MIWCIVKKIISLCSDTEKRTHYFYEDKAFFVRKQKYFFACKNITFWRIKKDKKQV